MTFIVYLLGIITGMLAMFFLLMIAFRAKPIIERKLNQLESKMKEKGKIIEPQDESLNEWVDSLKPQ